MNDNMIRIESGYKAFNRGGDYLYRVFSEKISYLIMPNGFPSEKPYLTAKDCMYLKDTYGMSIHCVVLMAISHGFEIDKDGFVKLLDEDDEKSKGMRNCSVEA